MIITIPRGKDLLIIMVFYFSLLYTRFNFSISSFLGEKRLLTPHSKHARIKVNDEPLRFFTV
jgi:hypothetical protein